MKKKEKRRIVTPSRSFLYFFSLLVSPCSPLLLLAPNLFHFGFEVRVVWVTERDKRQRHGLTRTSCNTKPKPSIAFFVFHLFFFPPLSFSFRLLASHRERTGIRFAPSGWIFLTHTIHATSSPFVFPFFSSLPFSFRTTA